ncbi:MAG: glucose-1-phosphate adenylyltransferase subunit GlgD [Oscillospiraceae bacterium]|nr:glucose-1-phosphate adenylyltransferase subunit GlgD [Oscillospiraceae bacterium]
MKETTGIILAQEKCDALRELTQPRTAGSVPFGGRYRLIDFTLSNMVNSGIRTVGVVTRNNYYSLMDHLGTGKEWDLNRKKGGLTILPPSLDVNMKRNTGDGKIEALYGVLDYIRHCGNKYILLADANVIAQVNYQELLEYHIEKNAYMTAVYQKDVFDSKRFANNTFIQVADDGRIIDVAVHQGIQLHSDMLLGVYIIERELLEFLICQCVAHDKLDFERDILQGMASDLDIYAYPISGYAQKIDSVDTFYQVHRDMLNPDVQEAMFGQGKVLTKVRDEVPTYYSESSCVKNSMIADGCTIEGTVENSVIFRSVHIGPGAVVRNSVIMQDCEIGANSVVEYCITDKLVTISEGRHMIGAETYPIVVAKGSKI